MNLRLTYLLVTLQDGTDMIKREHDADVLNEDHSIEIPCVKKEEHEVCHVIKWYLCPCVGLELCIFISQITGYLQCGMNK
jgi:hypothetical protein